MSYQIERRLRTAAQIANYGSHLGLMPYQIDDAVRAGIDQLDGGKSGTTAYQVGRKVVDRYARNQVKFEA